MVYKIIELLNALQLCAVYSGNAPKNAAVPYIVVNKYSEGYQKGDDRIDEVTDYIQVDYYTKSIYDENKDVIRGGLDDTGAEITYSKMYESDERLYHHIFDIRVGGTQYPL